MSKLGTTSAPSRLLLYAIGAAVLLAGAIGSAWHSGSRAEEGVLAPAPALDQPLAAGPPQTAVLAGGCFWGVQGVFQHVKGVQRVLSGYAGGEPATAVYEQVGTGATGHAESVEIIFDPAQISYGEILRIFFSVAHDPTQLNRQGPDVGTQYRSAIFFSDASQQQIAQAYIAQLDRAGTFAPPIVTHVDPLKGFFPAEDYHQDFLVRNPTYPYIVFNDLPKIANLKQLYPDRYREQPVTVAATP
jgi:peptide-methionine (S)-S-oxide reductase